MSVRGGLVLLGALLPVPAFCQAIDPAIAVDRQAYAQVQGMSFDYRERIDGALADRESGWTAGAGVGVRGIGTVLGVPLVYGSVEYRHQGGSVAYDGTDFAGNPLRQRSGLGIDSVTGELGKGFLVAPGLLVVPALQGGWRHWTRGLAVDETEGYRNGFAGVAVHANAALAPRLVASVRLGAAGVVGPRIDIVDQGHFDQALGSRALLQAGGRLDYALALPLHVFVQADATHFGFGRSAGDAIGEDEVLYEPSSTTTEVTTAVGVAYAF